METSKPTPQPKPMPPQLNDITAPVPAGSMAKKQDDSTVREPAPQLDDEQASANPADKPTAAAKPVTPKAPKAPRTPGVGLAIFAAVVIVLGLGALFTYAYLRSNDISLF